MRRRERKSKNINSVDVFKGLWVRPMRRGCDRREQSCEEDATEGSNHAKRMRPKGAIHVKRMRPKGAIHVKRMRPQGAIQLNTLHLQCNNNVITL